MLNTKCLSYEMVLTTGLPACNCFSSLSHFIVNAKSRRNKFTIYPNISYDNGTLITVLNNIAHLCEIKHEYKPGNVFILEKYRSSASYNSTVQSVRRNVGPQHFIVCLCTYQSVC